MGAMELGYAESTNGKIAQNEACIVHRISLEAVTDSYHDAQLLSSPAGDSGHVASFWYVVWNTAT